MPLTKEHGIYKFMAKLIPLRLGFEQDGEEFDFMKWIEEGGLDGINIAKLYEVITSGSTRGRLWHAHKQSLSRIQKRWSRQWRAHKQSLSRIQKR